MAGLGGGGLRMVVGGFGVVNFGVESEIKG